MPRDKRIEFVITVRPDVIHGRKVIWIDLRVLFGNRLTYRFYHHFDHQAEPIRGSMDQDFNELRFIHESLIRKPRIGEEILGRPLYDRCVRLVIQRLDFDGAEPTS